MSKIVYVTRKERFNAAHKLWHEEWSPEKNLEVFGKCSNPNWHGHNYELFVTIKGGLNEETGFCMDLKVLSTIIRTKVTDVIDHRNLNLDIPWLAGIKTSTENLAIVIWERIEQEIKEAGCQLHCVKLYETENNFVEYYGGE
jgi:6-pyruvoyltetrahydropterin/6-carboxytetrahydropterin synthase